MTERLLQDYPSSVILPFSSDEENKDPGPRRRGKADRGYSVSSVSFVICRPPGAERLPGQHWTAAIDAGFNPELIAFPETVYQSVLVSAGFESKIETIEIPSETGDNSGVLDPRHSSCLMLVEHSLRMVVENELRKLKGKNWYRSRVPGEIWQKWRNRRKEDEQKYHEPFPLIFYADFMDLSDIICRNDNWNDVFRRLFVCKDDIQESLRRLVPIRNSIAHNRPLVRTDRLTLVSEVCRILKVLDVQP